jgi:hypothetical protein
LTGGIWQGQTQPTAGDGRRINISKEARVPADHPVIGMHYVLA